MPTKLTYQRNNQFNSVKYLQCKYLLGKFDQLQSNNSAEREYMQFGVFIYQIQFNFPKINHQEVKQSDANKMTFQIHYFQKTPTKLIEVKNPIFQRWTILNFRLAIKCRVIKNTTLNLSYKIKKQSSSQIEQIRTKNKFFYHSSLVEWFDDLKQHFLSVLMNFVTKFEFCSNQKSISH
ncbi:hypothetical protein TTHERM_00079020 (macronuclear) [Tetrahymena thermophila SB210]|uniref:Uncharacterized protein n=1 Tax=Tetrahymena thermophila (strain SB210) TaxID=312017 RepID=Q23FW2_TETTS|nr:hypothetical protein TTHERM_00079020 [Tetrahymena thermophila SB210]EAR95498.1 hypothetical protein TTHERM_00079020 [Tetrahymena thermophila SB210]|eukprot:XP_001015743.1 hypothetical protein TTHERM_00079020 [Tetrahymena thermophila SB210]